MSEVALVAVVQEVLYHHLVPLPLPLPLTQLPEAAVAVVVAVVVLIPRVEVLRGAVPDAVSLVVQVDAK
jgi:hypothetical protein